MGNELKPARRRRCDRLERVVLLEAQGDRLAEVAREVDDAMQALIRKFELYHEVVHAIARVDTEAAKLIASQHAYRGPAGRPLQPGEVIRGGGGFAGHHRAPLCGHAGRPRRGGGGLMVSPYLTWWLDEVESEAREIEKARRLTRLKIEEASLVDLSRARHRGGNSRGRQPKGLRLAEMLGNRPLGWEEQRMSWGLERRL